MSAHNIIDNVGVKYRSVTGREFEFTPSPRLTPEDAARLLRALIACDGSRRRVNRFKPAKQDR